MLNYINISVIVMRNRQRQVDNECRAAFSALVRLLLICTDTFNIDPAVVFLDYFVRNGKAEARALDICCKEGIKDVLSVIG